MSQPFLTRGQRDYLDYASDLLNELGRMACKQGMPMLALHIGAAALCATEIIDGERAAGEKSCDSSLLLQDNKQRFVG